VAPLIDYLQELATLDASPQSQLQLPGPPQGSNGQNGGEPPTVTDMSKVQVDRSKMQVDQSKIQSDRVSDAVAVAGAVAELQKAGFEISDDDLNKVLTDMNLPPINPNSTPAVPPEVHQKVEKPQQAAKE